MERTDAVRDLSQAVVRFVEDARTGMERAFDLTRVRVLQLVDARGPLRPGDICRALGMAASSVTRHVQALEDAGQLLVTEDPDDARTCRIQATDAGRDELERIAQTGAAVFAGVVRDWDTGDLRTLAMLLRRLAADWAERGGASRRRSRPANPPRWRYPADQHDSS